LVARTDHRADGAGPPAAGAEGRDDTLVPVFRIVAIGDMGSGKSTFISTLYQHLSVDGDGRRGYYLSAGLDRSIGLNSDADTTARPGPLWQAKTERVEDRIDLDFQVPLAGAPAGVLRIRLTDYPGEFLRDANAGSEDQRGRLRAAVAEADALLLLVDGHRLLRALEGASAERREFEESLRATVNVAQDAPMIHSGRPAPPVQVLVTKWDLLAAKRFGGTYKLPRVRAVLMENEHFRTLVQVRRAARGTPGAEHGRVRIIPVSVLGFDAVEQYSLEQNGIASDVHVKSDAVRAPINLDVPISAVLPDRLDQILAGLSPRTLRRAKRHERLELLAAQGGKVKRIARLADSTQETISSVIGWIVPGPSEQASRTVLALAAQWAEQKPGAGAAGPSLTLETLRRVDRHAVLARRTLLQRFAGRLALFQQTWEGWDAEEGLQEYLENRPESMT
jgi:hypothetical protein